MYRLLQANCAPSSSLRGLGEKEGEAGRQAGSLSFTSNTIACLSFNSLSAIFSILHLSINYLFTIHLSILCVSIVSLSSLLSIRLLCFYLSYPLRHFPSIPRLHTRTGPQDSNLRQLYPNLTLGRVSVRVFRVTRLVKLTTQVLTQLLNAPSPHSNYFSQPRGSLRVLMGCFLTCIFQNLCQTILSHLYCL